MAKKEKEKMIEWHTERRCIDDLIPFEGNPRSLNDQQTTALKKSLKRFGLAEIPAIDTDNTILAGHARLRVMQMLGRGGEEIDVRLPSRPLSEDERKSYLLTSNAVTGSWDYDLLKNFDTDLILDIGFDSDILTHLFDDSLETENDDFDEIKELSKLKKPTVKLGEFYQLGAHRLGCIDSTNLVAVKKLVGDERIDFIDVDPPFGIRYSYSGKNGKYGGQEKDDRPPEEYKTFIRSLIANSLAVAKKDAHVLFFCDERFVWLLQMLYAELGIASKRLAIWVKGNAMPTVDTAFGKATEFAAYGTIGSPYLNKNLKNLSTLLNKEIGSGNRAIDDIVDLFNIWLVKRLPGNEYEHPTQKPPTLHEKALRRCTKVGDTLLDLTAGSGSLMVAAEQMKRRAFLAEQDPIFATLIKNRYEKITGLKARKLN